MKVLVVTHDLNSRNAHLMPWRTVCEVVEGGRKQGYNLMLVSLGRQRQRLVGPGIPVGTVSVSKAGGDLENQLGDLIASQQDDVVLLWPVVWREPYWRTRIAGRLGVTLIGYFPGGVYHLRDALYAVHRIGLRKASPYLAEAAWPKARQIRHLYASGFSGMIAMTHFTADAAVSAGWPKERIRVIPPGRDGDELSRSNVALPEDFIEWRNGRPFYMFAGPPSGIRGIYELLKAFDRLANDHKDVCLVCLFRSDGSLDADRIAGVIRRMAHSKRVFCVWESLDKEQLELFMAECHATVLPFVAVPSEIPLAMIEAMRFGKPVITTMTGGSGGFVESSGEAVPLGDIKGLTLAMSRLLSDTDYYQKKCTKTLEVYANHPTWQVMAARWLECILDTVQVAELGGDRK